MTTAGKTLFCTSWSEGRGGGGWTVDDEPPLKTYKEANEFLEAQRFLKTHGHMKEALRIVDDVSCLQLAATKQTTLDSWLNHSWFHGTLIYHYYVFVITTIKTKKHTCKWNLSTRDKGPVPEVSFVWRFYCSLRCHCQGSGHLKEF